MKFELTPEQIEKLLEWQLQKEEEYGGAIGGRWTYSFTPTSLGIVVKVRDAIDKSEIDLTNYDEW